MTVWVGGRDVTPDTLGELSLKGGRSDFLGTPDAVTLSLSLEWPTWMAIPVIGEEVAVLGWLPGSTPEATGRALFFGHVTDVACEGDVVSVLAVDPMRRLDGVYIGDTPWPQEFWHDRVARVIDLGVQSLPGDATWLAGINILAPLFGGQRMPRRDVDRQEMLAVLDDYIGPAGIGIYYSPHFHSSMAGGSPADPSQWAPRARYALLLQKHELLPTTGALGRVRSHGLVGDPPYRLSMNLGPVTNEWKAFGPVIDWYTGDAPAEGVSGEWQVVETLPPAVRDRYGPSNQSLNSQALQFYYPTTGEYGAAFTELADAWLRRTGYPTWAADGVTRVFEAGDTYASQEWAWLLQHGVGVCGEVVKLQGVQGSTEVDADNFYTWVVEGLEVVWTETGWEVTFTALTDPSVYRGTVTSDPIDPRSNVSLQSQPPALIHTGGWLLHPLWYSQGVQGAAGGYWRAVAPALGVAGPAVINGGTGTLLPTGPLPTGKHRLVIQRLATAASAIPTDWLEIEVAVAAGYVWPDIADTVTWADVPEELTWAAAAQAADWEGPQHA